MTIVYGGAFNPPTIAHRQIVERIRELFKPERIVIVPVGTSYQKPELIANQYRYEMAKIAFPKCEISDIEFNDSYRGTYQTLEALGYEDTYYVIGADNLVFLNKWLNFDELISKYKFIVFNRDQMDISKIIEKKYKQYENQFVVVDFNYVAASRIARKNIYGCNQIDLDVLEYIKQNKLYEE